MTLLSVVYASETSWPDAAVGIAGIIGMMFIMWLTFRD